MKIYYLDSASSDYLYGISQDYIRACMQAAASQYLKQKSVFDTSTPPSPQS